MSRSPVDDLAAAIAACEAHHDLVPHVDDLCDLRARLDRLAQAVSSKALGRLHPLCTSCGWRLSVCRCTPTS